MILLAVRRFNADRAFALYDAVLDAFAELGLDAAQSAAWFRLVGGFVRGAAMAEVASREHVADATPPRLERDGAHIAYAHVRAVTPYLQVGRLDTVFDFGLDVIFGALAASVTAAAPAALAPGPT